MAQYGKPDYWENRYIKDPEPFDWYQKYSENPHLKGTLNKHIPKTASILIPGCGSSRLSEEMVADGYTGGIANIDISRTVIDLMAARAKGRDGMTCAFFTIAKGISPPSFFLTTAHFHCLATPLYK